MHLHNKISTLVNRELTNLLYKNFALLLIAESIGAIIYTTMLWNYVNQTFLLGWLSLNLLICGLMRQSITFAFKRAKKLNRIENYATWKKTFTAAAACSGTIWGLGGCLFYLVPDSTMRLIIVFCMIAVTGIGNIVCMPSKITYFVFVTPVYASTLLMLFIHGSLDYYALGVGVVILFFLSTKIIFNGNFHLVNILWLQFQNEELIYNLSKAKYSLENFNVKLKKEVRSRLEIQKILQNLATIDHLTGIPNRKLLMERLKTALSNAKQNHTYVALLYIDLDNFKEINDTYGHDTGDQLLIDVAKRLTQLVRNTDTVSRLGGDEFCIVVPDIRDLHNLDLLGQKICKNLALTFLINTYKIETSSSIGIAIYPNDAENMQELFDKADIALYQAKNAGKNQVACYKENKTHEGSQHLS